MSLLLAERMVDKFVKENKIEAEAEVLTYLHILETQVRQTYFKRSLLSQLHLGMNVRGTWNKTCEERVLLNYVEKIEHSFHSIRLDIREFVMS